MNAVPKLNIIRDETYRIWLRDQPCVLTGWHATETDPVEAMHIGTLGKGIKSSDDEALPVKHSLHVFGHQHGEISMIRKQAPDWLIREAFKALAREMYRQYAATHSRGKNT